MAVQVLRMSNRIVDLLHEWPAGYHQPEQREEMLRMPGVITLESVHRPWESCRPMAARAQRMAEAWRDS